MYAIVIPYLHKNAAGTREKTWNYEGKNFAFIIVTYLLAACYVKNEGKTDLPFLLPQFIDGILQTLCGLNDIIVGPEVGILEELTLSKKESRW